MNKRLKKRFKEIRPEINYKIVENHAKEIIDFEVGYVFGSPVNFTHRNGQNGDEQNDDNNINTLNEMFHVENKASKDHRLGECIKTCGVGYRMVLAKRKRT